MNLLAIVPYAALQELFTKAEATGKDPVFIDTLVGNLQDAISYLSEEAAGKYDCIISRGGTAKMLRHYADIPIIEIEISFYDMLRIIRTAQQYGKPFAIVGYANVTNIARTICDILNYSITIRELSETDDVEDCLCQLKKSGISLIVGDVIAVETAGRQGMSNLLITSSLESVEQAIQNAVQLMENIRLAAAGSAVFQKVLDSCPLQAFLFSESGSLLYVNGSLSEQYPSKQKLREYLTAQFPILREQGRLRLTRKLGSTILDIRGQQFSHENCTYYAFFVNTSCAGNEINASCLSVESTQQAAQSPSLLPGSPCISPLLEKLTRIPPSSPIHINGEIGCGKKSLARYIHKTGTTGGSSFITIDCSLLNEKIWDNLSNRADSPLSGSGYTFYFKDVDKLPLLLQKLIDSYMEDTRFTARHRIISCACADLSAMIAAGRFLSSFHYKLCGATLHLPPLRERMGDIAAISSLYISEFNMQFGKEIIGFRDEAMQLLKEYSWPLNVAQLKDTVRQLVLTADDYYIRAEDVKQLLSSSDSLRYTAAPVSLAGTLDEIEQEIIRRVMLEENFNQTQAAARLGISRSTLWRKLKEST